MQIPQLSGYTYAAPGEIFAVEAGLDGEKDIDRRLRNDGVRRKRLGDG